MTYIGPKLDIYDGHKNLIAEYMILLGFRFFNFIRFNNHAWYELECVNMINIIRRDDKSTILNVWTKGTSRNNFGLLG